MWALTLNSSWSTLNTVESIKTKSIMHLRSTVLINSSSTCCYCFASSQMFVFLLRPIIRKQQRTFTTPDICSVNVRIFIPYTYTSCENSIFQPITDKLVSHVIKSEPTNFQRNGKNWPPFCGCGYVWWMPSGAYAQLHLPDACTGPTERNESQAPAWQ